MTCEECVSLSSHEFRGPDDLVYLKRMALKTTSSETPMSAAIAPQSDA